MNNSQSVAGIPDIVHLELNVSALATLGLLALMHTIFALLDSNSPHFTKTKRFIALAFAIPVLGFIVIFVRSVVAAFGILG